MRFKRGTRRIAGAATLVLVIAVAPLTSRAQTEAPPARDAYPVSNHRELVRLAPADREAILLEMRTMLQGVSDILHALVDNDLAKAEKAARASGMASAIDASFEKKLPTQFFQLGMRTHKRFDAVADAVKAGATRDTIMRRLAAVTASCVTCHATFRLENAP
jgi:cytochrome c556